MDTTTVVLVVLVVLALVAVGVVAAMVRRRSERHRSEELRDRFGPEYDRSVEAADDRDGRREAERELRRAAERRDALEIRPVTAASRKRYVERWGEVQTSFVETPVEAVEAARALVVDVMAERGYPTEDTDERARMLAADHGEVVEHHRAAEGHRERYRAGSGTTEDLRQAFVHYHRLFDVLLDDEAAGPTGGDDTPRAVDVRERHGATALDETR